MEVRGSIVKQRLDVAMMQRQLVPTRSQAESWIKLGKVTVDGKPVMKPGFMVSDISQIKLLTSEQYVSRAGLKLASVASLLGLSFPGKIVLDVGSSTGGFTDYALQHGADKVIAVDVGTDQLHASLHNNPKIELHEKTDIRDFVPNTIPSIVVIDVSFVSLRRILPHIANIIGKDTQVVAMVKPQFEASRSQITSGGIVKNDRVRRDILKDFELWVKQAFSILNKIDSGVAGAHGNKERFYLLMLAKK